MPANEATPAIHKLEEGKEPADMGTTMSHELEKAFHKFAVYGSTNATGNEMTGKNFSKLCKECSIQEHGCTSTDVDIVFAKVKSMVAHVINYEEFKKAMELLSAKRFQRMPANEAIAAIHKLVDGKVPANMGSTKAVTAGAVDCLIDTQNTWDHTMNVLMRVAKAKA
ncbi:unnamed protein product [Ranitomeya imitator]|uniref:Uncharacterized protein n=1 Tax=Ranitomeya imitator TaxID=111125 RepID=A0ABN9M938_9NEOB|nr:unnamed protein product [Ranitomeya imitator]